MKISKKTIDNIEQEVAYCEIMLTWRLGRASEAHELNYVMGHVFEAATKAVESIGRSEVK